MGGVITVLHGIRWSVLGLLSLGASAAAAPADSQRVAATVVEQATPSVWDSSKADRHEGWVLLSRCIDKDGRVVNPIVIDSSGYADLEEAAREGARKSTYTAATLDGTAIDSCDQHVLMQFQLDDTDHGARPEFLTALKVAATAVEAKQYDEAVKALDAIGNWNTEEGIRMAILRAELAREQHDAAGQLRWLLNVLDSPAQVPVTMAADLGRRAFALQLQAQQYAAALATFQQLQGLQGVELSASELKAGEQLQALPDGDAAFATPGRLDARFAGTDQSPTWSTALLRREFAFTSATGDPEHFELRCENKHYSSAFNTDNQWRVPDSWGKCWLFVFGPADATFKLVELPKAPAAN
jgi:TonB family protein